MFYKRGSLIIEVVVAIAVSALILTASVILSFSGQNSLIKYNLFNDGFTKLINHLNKLNSEVALDWNLANLLIEDLKVTDYNLSPCLKVLEASYSVSKDIKQTPLSLKASMDPVLRLKKLGGNCYPFLPSGWDSVSVTDKQTGLVFPEGIIFSDLSVASIDGKSYAFLTSIHNAKETADLWVFDVSDPKQPYSLVSQVDLGVSGYNALVVKRSFDSLNSNPKFYAYLLNSEKTEHLQIVDVSDPSDIDLEKLLAVRSLPNMTSGIARSIFYYDKHIYIGTQYLGCPICSPERNNEFHIFNVENVFNSNHMASIDVNRNVNDIWVDEGVAYLATGPGSAGTYNPLRIFDVDPQSADYLKLTSLFFASGNEQGRSLYLLGEHLYLGLDRATSGRPDFYVLDISTTPNLNIIFSKNLNQRSGSMVSDLFVQGDKVFLASTDSSKPITFFDIKESGNIEEKSVCLNNESLNAGFNKIIYHDNFITTLSNDNSGIKILYDNESVCQ